MLAKSELLGRGGECGDGEVSRQRWLLRWCLSRVVAARVVFVKRDGQGPLEEEASAWTLFFRSSLFHIVARLTTSLKRSIE